MSAWRKHEATPDKLLKLPSGRSPAAFSSSHQRRLELGRLSGARRRLGPGGGGAVPPAVATVALVAQLDPRWGVSVSPGEDGRRGYVFSAGDGCVELTGEGRGGDAAARRHH